MHKKLPSILELKKIIKNKKINFNLKIININPDLIILKIRLVQILNFLN